MRKITLLFLFLIFSLTVVSCNMTADDDTVQISFYSLIPANYAAENSIEYSRSATPAFNFLNYDIIAVCGNKTIKRTTDTPKFTLPLYEGEWNITVNVFYSGDTQKATLFTGFIKPQISSNVSQNSPLYTIPLSLYKNEEGDVYEGSGKIKLPVAFTENSKISYLKYILSSDNEYHELRNFENGLGFIEYSEIPARLEPYQLTIFFYSDEDEILYLFHTDIMVFANNTTDTWRSEIELDKTSEGNTLNSILITNELVSAHQTRYFYVENKMDSSNEGTYEQPYKTMQQALNKVKSVARNAGIEKPFILYVKGNIPQDAGILEINETDTELNGLNIVIKGMNNGQISSLRFNSDLSENIKLTLSNIKINRISLGKTDLYFENIQSQKLFLDKYCSASISGTNSIEELYLPVDKNDNQILLNIDGNISGSSIGIRTETKPNLEKLAVCFTKDYSDKNIMASLIFNSIEGYSLGTDENGEAIISASKGSIYASIREDVAIVADRTEVSKNPFDSQDYSDLTLKFRLELKSVPITMDKISDWHIDISVSETTGKIEDSSSITFESCWPPGTYTVSVRCKYNGQEYSDEIKVELIEGK